MRPRARRPRASWLLVIATVAAAMLAARCGPDLALGIPADGALLDETPVHLRGRVRRAVDFPTLELRLDGVDLLAALGLTPPFADAAGMVDVNGTLVTVTELSFDPTVPGNPVRIEGHLDGLPLGPHTLELAGVNTAGAVPEPVSAVTAFELLAGFAQSDHVVAAAGLPEGPRSAGSEGVLVNATLGQPLAGPRVTLAGGDVLRPGFPEAAEARLQAAGP